MAHVPRTSLLLFAHLAACVSTTSGSVGRGDTDGATAVDLPDIARANDMIDATTPLDAAVVPDATAEMDIPSPFPTDDVQLADRPRIVGDTLFFVPDPCEGADCRRAVEIQLSAFSGLIRLRDGSYRTWGDPRTGLFPSVPAEVSVFPLPVHVPFGADTRIRLATYACLTVDRDGRVTRRDSGTQHFTLPPVIPEFVDVFYARYPYFLSPSGRLIEFATDRPDGLTTFVTPSDVTTLPTGAGTLCVGAPSGVWCWGSNQHGQVGHDYDRRDSQTPVRAAIPGGPFRGVTQVTGFLTRCAIIDRDLQNSAEVWCWGNNAHLYAEGEIRYTDLNGQRYTPVPVQVEELSGTRRIAVATDALCALMPDGTVRCAGHNDWGQVGTGTPSERETWTTVPGLRNVVDIASSLQAFCALTAEGEVWCWGTTGSLLLWFASPDTAQIVPPTRVRWQ